MKNTTAPTLESIVGQQRAVRFLSRAIEKDRLAHALLFSGIDGVGKQTAATATAMALNCTNRRAATACGACRSCRKIISGHHPDMIWIQPRGASIKIDQIRDVQKRLIFAPVEGRRRVVVINDAHTMNAEASNAMLKMLEEPPDNTHLILTAHQASDLLPTIVSRCQPVSFSPLSLDVITAQLTAAKGLDEQTAVAVALLAKGSLGRAMRADVGRWMAWRKKLMETITALCDSSVHALFAFAEELASDKDRLEDALDLIMFWFRDLLMAKVCPEKITNRDLQRLAERDSERFSIHDLVEKMTLVSETRQAITRNVNRRLALEVMLLGLVGKNVSSPKGDAKPFKRT
ncbi:MAG: DNA polymerase III subunit delta' [Deltaproteobacteria bacterium]|nr:DNA polymerase III subunit delta' [Deltaproteobacteria bacterium]